MEDADVGDAIDETCSLSRGNVTMIVCHAVICTRSLKLCRHLH